MQRTTRSRLWAAMAVSGLLLATLSCGTSEDDPPISPQPNPRAPTATPPPAATETPPPSPTPPPPGQVPETAPDFTLETTGGTFTLSDQLAQGPVVLVFFQRASG